MGRRYTSLYLAKLVVVGNDNSYAKEARVGKISFNVNLKYCAGEIKYGSELR
jgi:hypothetical protein